MLLPPVPRRNEREVVQGEVGAAVAGSLLIVGGLGSGDVEGRGEPEAASHEETEASGVLGEVGGVAPQRRKGAPHRQSPRRPLRHQPAPPLRIQIILRAEPEGQHPQGPSQVLRFKHTFPQR